MSDNLTVDSFFVFMEDNYSEMSENSKDGVIMILVDQINQNSENMEKA